MKKPETDPKKRWDALFFILGQTVQRAPSDSLGPSPKRSFRAPTGPHGKIDMTGSPLLSPKTSRKTQRLP